MELLLVALASLMAGFVDAIVGGGGLVLLPALFASFPHAPPATLLGVNKGAALCGTTLAALQYSRRVTLPWAMLIPAALAGFVGSFGGAWLVTLVSPQFLRQLLPFVLVLVLIYTLLKKELGQQHAPRYQGLAQGAAAALLALVLGFYDGFFGPGAGSFLVFFFVRWLGFDFLNASANVKVINSATNLAAFLLFVAKGHVWWHYVLVLALANIVGSLLGTRLALKHGAGFVRLMFLGVVSLLIIKTGYDGFLR